MNGEQAERFQQLLVEACDNHIDNGGKVVSGIFYTADGGKCPLSCLFGSVIVIHMAQELKSLVGGQHSEDELWAFVTSFDAKELAEYQKQYVSAILIGKELRRKYITKE